MSISIISYQQALLDETKDLPKEVFPHLLQIIRLFKESLYIQKAKKQSIQTFDEKISLMRQAANDSTFLSDLRDINKDFKEVDSETWETV